MHPWKIVLAISCCLLVAACGEESQMQNLVREQLRDPDSAKFKDVVTSEDGRRACIQWNAKNSMGGYGDWQVSELLKDGTHWAIVEFEGSPGDCNEVGFKSKDDVVIAKRAAFQKAKEILRTSRSISDSDAEKLLTEGSCKQLFRSYGISAELNARWESKGNFDHILKKQEERFRDGTCDPY
jgi:hypothetical protein